jgi:L-ribulose-5-phosphate 4-epimerase
MADAADSLVDLAGKILSRGLVGLNQHGNLSFREEGADYIWMTGSSLTGLAASGILRVGLDGSPIDAGMRGTEAEVIRMHTEAYRARPDVGCVVHTHAPYATAYAVASRPLPCVAESMARQGYLDPVPLAGYAPRGSAASVAAIVSAIESTPGTPAVLLEAHGVLVLSKDPDAAFRQLMALEEAAQLAVLAAGLGGARGLSRSEAEAALVR